MGEKKERKKVQLGDTASSILVDFVVMLLILGITAFIFTVVL